MWPIKYLNNCNDSMKKTYLDALLCDATPLLHRSLWHTHCFVKFAWHLDKNKSHCSLKDDSYALDTWVDSRWGKRGEMSPPPTSEQQEVVPSNKLFVNTWVTQISFYIYNTQYCFVGLTTKNNSKIKCPLQWITIMNIFMYRGSCSGLNFPFVFP